MRQFTVQKPISLGYDSHVHRQTPPRHKTLMPGSIIRLDDEAPNGNVWFIDEDDERGKIQCGEVRNLTRDGRIVETPNDKAQLRSEAE